MDDAFLGEGDEAVDDVLEDVDGFVFGEGGVLGDVVFKVVVAEFLDDVVVVGTLHDFIDGHDVGRLDLLQDLYLL